MVGNNNLTVRDTMWKALEVGGFDGLFMIDPPCACKMDEHFMGHCGDDCGGGCEAGYLAPCDKDAHKHTGDGEGDCETECEFHIGGVKPK